MLGSQHRDTYPGANESANWRATARYTEGYKRLRTFRTSTDRRLLDEAEKLLREAVAIDPAYQAARFHLGVVEELQGRHEDAAHQFEELLALVDKVPAEVLYNTGLAYFHHYTDEGYEKAEGYLRKATEAAGRGVDADHHSPTYQAIAVLARAVLAQVYSHRSIQPPNETAEKFRPTAEKYYSKALGTADQALKEFQSSETEIERLDPRLKSDIGWGIYNARGHAKLYAARRCENGSEKEKLFEAAVGEFKQALKYDPNNIRVLSNIGSAKFFLAEARRDASKGALLEEAEREFQRVLSLRPDYDFAFYRLAEIEIRRGCSEAATKYLELAERHPSEMTPERLQDLKKKIESMPIRLPEVIKLKPPHTN